jgi:predicted lysophospholipase L1 biosynthesis ABC-type transport system permease subunit
MATQQVTQDENELDSKGGIRPQYKLPLSIVVGITMNGIKIRLWRSVITASGIALSIAFFAYVYANLLSTPQMSVDDKHRQIWLIIMSITVTLVGIVNSMLMAVTERFREIGTMKCLGAVDRFVTTMFVIEAVFMGSLASIIGWIIGFSVSVISHLTTIGWTQTWIDTSWSTFLYVLGASLLLGVSVTLVAALIPAQQAARMPAAMALRSDI